jgi:energy-coupling factor transporter ATP-binding protein EcfA2
MKLHIENFAQIKSVEVDFGDFTLITGTQASGKSIFMQTLKLLLDRRVIFDTLEKNGFDWKNKPENLLALYFGEAMSKIWDEKALVQLTLVEEIQSWDLKKLLNRKGKISESDKKEKLFYVPAQRVLTMAQGWARPFSSFESGEPYILKAFSENVRLLLQDQSEGVFFPRAQNIKKDLREMIDQSIFYGKKVKSATTSTSKKQFELEISEKQSLPFLLWSAGQKEFMPLLLTLYYLMPSSKISKKEGIDWIVLEEPEMGLHPKAIQTVMMIALELLSRGYRVIITTHSPVFLELAWTINFIKKYNAPADELFELFSIPKSNEIKKIFENIIAEKTFKTYSFQRKEDGIYSKDISSLDASSDDENIADWGGLSAFSSKAVDVVSKIVAKYEKWKRE